jgi:hypothetical protein
MPQAALAAVVVAYSVGLISPMEFGTSVGSAASSSAGRWSRSRAWCYWARSGILVAVIVSLLALAHQTNNPPVYALEAQAWHRCV